MCRPTRWPWSGRHSRTAPAPTPTSASGLCSARESSDAIFLVGSLRHLLHSQRGAGGGRALEAIDLYGLHHDGRVRPVLGCRHVCRRHGRPLRNAQTEEGQEEEEEERQQQQRQQQQQQEEEEEEKRAVGALLMATTTSIPSTIFPNTGCAEGVCGLNQSRKSLCTVLMKN